MIAEDMMNIPTSLTFPVVETGVEEFELAA